MNPQNPYSLRLFEAQTRYYGGAERRSPSRVLGGPQPGLLATNQTYLKGA